MDKQTSRRSAPRLVTVIVAMLVAVLWAPAAAPAHDDFKTPRGHMLEDAVSHTPASERALVRQTARTTASDAQAAAAAVAGLPQDVGTWGPVVPWPVVGVHVALLPNGKVLAYDSVGDAAAEKFTVHDHTRATVYDPAKGTFTPVDVSAFNIFCSGAAHLADGSVFVAGGNLNAQLQGIVQTHLFNPVTNTWSRGPNMAAARWYPTVTALPNGEMLITEGGPDVPEVRTTAGTLRRLTSASQDLPLYPWMDVGPDGRTYYTGPNQTMRALQPSGTGSWTTFGQRDAINRTYGGHAMYDVGKILVAGGGASSRDARVININGASPTVSATAPMAFGRRQHNLTALADGSVLATGGNSSGADLVDINNGVYAAELWNPATGTWRTLEAMRTTRQYHSTALLLPDARVLVSGGGLCDACDAAGYLAKNAETFTPPYLYKKDGSGALATRPSIASAPTTVRYGAPFSISTPEAASIGKVALIRLGAVTHSVNMEQRYVPLSFTRASGALTATAPANANIAPTGMYMLFVIDANGVPSVAKMVSVAPGAGGSAPTVTLTQPANGATFTAPATVNLAANASDTDGTISRVEFFNGSVKVGEDLTAPYTFAWTGVGAGTYSVTARATDNSGASATSAAASITVQSSTTPPPAGTNVAPSAAVTASSETASTGALAIKAVDGDTRGYPAAPDREWATQGQKAGAWLNLAWAAPQRIGSVTLYDRPNLNDHVTGATLTFSDGSTVSTGVLNNNGAATTITFPARTTTSLRFTVTSAATTTVNVGLAEIQAFTADAAPTGSPPSVTLTQPANGATFAAPATIDLAATASDADGAVSKVEFFNGTVKLGEDLTAPYTFSWTGVGGGTYSVTARATDATGLTATSAAASVTVQGGTTTPPPGTNVAPQAAVTASSETASTGALAIKAVDGDTRGYPAAPDREWATLREKAGAWLNLVWSAPQRIGSVTLFDRPNADDQVTGATLTFSDGSTVTTGTLANNGAATTITFPARTTTSLRFTVTTAAATTVNIGLAEIQAFTAP